MPQLTALEICSSDEERDDPDITIKTLNDMSITYPLLESIKFENIHFAYLENDDVVYTSFLFVQSLHMDNCTDGTDVLTPPTSLFFVRQNYH